jgi:hypothetical protein
MQLVRLCAGKVLQVLLKLLRQGAASTAQTSGKHGHTAALMDTTRLHQRQQFVLL